MNNINKKIDDLLKEKEALEKDIDSDGLSWQSISAIASAICDVEDSINEIVSKVTIH